MNKIIEALLILGASIFLTSCGVIKGYDNSIADKGIKWVEEVYPQDNWLENNLEDRIESATGIKTDLSPNSEEEDDRWEKK